MLRFTLLVSLAVLLGAAKASRGHVSLTLLQEIAALMREPVKDRGQCDVGCCVEIEHEDGTIEYKLLEDGERVASPKNACHIYRCEGSRLKLLVTEQCQERVCQDGKRPVKAPDKCCPECTGDQTEGGCEFSEWSDFGECSAACGEIGEKIRVRRLISVEEGADAVSCNGNLREVMECPGPPCPVHCEYRESCTPCSATCGNATMQCIITVTQEAENGGRPCPFPRVQTLQCTDLPPCTPEPCEWEYRNCTPCSATCGDAERVCIPVVTKEAKHKGECPDFVLLSQPQLVKCENQPVCPPEPCEWEYRNCGRCTATCGPAEKECIPVVTKEAKHDGTPCPDFTRTGRPRPVTCENQPTCPPVPCLWRYISCGPCSATCGDAEKMCTPRVTRQAENGGDDCPEFAHKEEPQQVKCDGLKPCPVKCRRDEHVCVVKGVEVCVLTRLDPKKLCECIVTEPNIEKRKKIDWDLDFVHNKCDNCQKVENEDQKDSDTDGVGDLCDNCVNDANRDQTDRDKDGKGTACDDYEPRSPFIQEETETDENKNLAAQIMEKLMEFYYSKK